MGSGNDLPSHNLNQAEKAVYIKTGPRTPANVTFSAGWYRNHVT